MEELTSEFKSQHGIAKVLELFSGGQKKVWIIEDVNGDRLAMKKFIHGSPRDRQELELLERFSEAPGIPKIIRIDEHAGEPILFEEYIEAPDLQRVMAEFIGNTDKVRAFILSVIEIMRPVWEQRIVHRDLKPANIKISEHGDVFILDFGIARDLTSESLTGTGEGQPMTHDYASPEQYAGEKSQISYRTDFFSLGIIAYRLYYGFHPFGNTRGEIEDKFTRVDNTFYLEERNPLNDFFTAVLSIEISGRPRSVDVLLSKL